MGRRQTDSKFSRCAILVLVWLGCISIVMVYHCFSVTYKPSSGKISLGSTSNGSGVEQRGEVQNFCRGIEHLELWGDAVNWGSNLKVNSPQECCKACKDMCWAQNRPCLCNSWVFCADKQACGSKFGEGIVGLETGYGTLHVKLLSDRAPYSVAYILELLALRHCAGCQFHHAESRGAHWDTNGNHIEYALYGSPFALIQGTLEADGVVFKEFPGEVSSPVRRGLVAWVGSGPEFFISMANQNEWKEDYNVFGFVLAQDMEIVERISQLPVKQEVWGDINVSVLEEPISLRFQRM